VESQLNNANNPTTNIVSEMRKRSAGHIAAAVPLLRMSSVTGIETYARRRLPKIRSAPSCPNNQLVPARGCRQQLHIHQAENELAIENAELQFRIHNGSRSNQIGYFA
jgi:hypothetical protein